MKSLEPNTNRFYLHKVRGEKFAYPLTTESDVDKFIANFCSKTIERYIQRKEINPSKYWEFIVNDYKSVFQWAEPFFNLTPEEMAVVRMLGGINIPDFARISYRSYEDSLAMTLIKFPEVFEQLQGKPPTAQLLGETILPDGVSLCRVASGDLVKGAKFDYDTALVQESVVDGYIVRLESENERIGIEYSQLCSDVVAEYDINKALSKQVFDLNKKFFAGEVTLKEMVANSWFLKTFDSDSKTKSPYRDWKVGQVQYEKYVAIHGKLMEDGVDWIKMPVEPASLFSLIPTENKQSFTDYMNSMKTLSNITSEHELEEYLNEHGTGKLDYMGNMKIGVYKVTELS